MFQYSSEHLKLLISFFVIVVFGWPEAFSSGELHITRFSYIVNKHFYLSPFFYYPPFKISELHRHKKAAPSLGAAMSL